MSRSDRGGRPRSARYSHAGESGPQPPSAFGISPRKAGGERFRAFLSVSHASSSDYSAVLYRGMGSALIGVLALKVLKPDVLAALDLLETPFERGEVIRVLLWCGFEVNWQTE